ncbi:peroxisomal membrane protein PEX13 isoform X2 [Phymastichus coffea]|nr:peroxisomal membrane protein PEX13 isoform X2 [Phymastichus coffea]
MGVAQSGVSAIAPPPVPPRRPVSTYQSYSPFGSSYLGSSLSSYGYGSGYNSYGFGRYGMGMGMGIGSYPGYSMYGQNQWGSPSGDVENRFVQYAEESTRPAFQSIEAMVHTFSSLTMMLESTFFAMTSSFRAILGVADNMGKLRTMLKQLFSSFALVRLMKWLYYKVKYMLGLRNQNLNSEVLWRETISEVLHGSSEQNGTSSWPIFVFLSILFATPYLIHKLVSNAKNISVNVNNPKEWLQNKEPVHTATAIYDFTAASNEELSLKTGQKVWLAPQSLQPKNLPGWWRATDSINVGLIPSTYVTVVGQLKKKLDSNQSQTSSSYQPTPIIENLTTEQESSESQIINDFNKEQDESFAKSKSEDIFKVKNESN